MKYFLFGVLIAFGGIGVFFWQKNVERTTTNFVQEMMEKQTTTPTRPYIEIQNPSGFVNTQGITIGEQIGKKVVLVDILTYSCINCVRTFPYLNAWYDKYKDDGLEIIGIHTPEFAFEKKKGNVEEAMQKYGIKFPVVLDNDYSTWRAYKNNYWPRKYLIDINGNIVYDHIGEGAYEQTEKKIQELLEERKQKLGLNMNIDKDMTKPEGAQVPSQGNISPEVYFGAARSEGVGNGSIKVGVVQTFTEPKEIKLNTLYLVGDWEFTDEYLESKSKNARIIFRYNSKNVFFVASSLTENNVKILKDGVVFQNVKIQNEELYSLIQGTEVGTHTIEIQIPEPGLQAFTFTFG